MKQDQVQKMVKSQAYFPNQKKKVMNVSGIAMARYTKNIKHKLMEYFSQNAAQSESEYTLNIQ